MTAKPPKPKGRAVTADITSWFADTLPAQPGTFPPTHKDAPMPSPAPPAEPTHQPLPPTTYGQALGPVFVRREPRRYTLRFPPTTGDGEVKTGSTIWDSQRTWLKQAALDHRTTVQDLVREAIDDLRVKLGGR